LFLLIIFSYTVFVIISLILKSDQPLPEKHQIKIVLHEVKAARIYTGFSQLVMFFIFEEVFL